ncbi:hypothetical protein [Pantoea sp. BAV 3049]|uniref:hypothetical protein n=1 Tax=Pantoea sp. BAV 3049 TaxID=2654188 RepID=UPI00131DA4C7|nr:hypothetical protein [Pantoea sp. BAV 3049]
MTNDELERQAFEEWFDEVCRPGMSYFNVRKAERDMVQEIAEMAWQARARQESNHD